MKSFTMFVYLLIIVQYASEIKFSFNSKFLFVLFFPVASKKSLTYFNHDYKADLQEVSFDQQEVKKIFYGSFHKVLIKKGRNVAHYLIPLTVLCHQRVLCKVRSDYKHFASRLLGNQQTYSMCSSL